MAHRLILRKRGKTLVAEDVLAMDYIGRLREGEYVRAQLTVPRNIKHHRLLFALLKIVLDGQAEPAQFPTTEGLLDALKIATGHVREVRDLHGNTHFVPVSIDFATMDQVRFREWFDRAVEVILQRILPHCARADLEQQVYNMLGEGGPAQLERYR